MNKKERNIIKDYVAQRDNFVLLGDIVSAKLKVAVNEAGLDVLAVEHRVKSEQSLIGKLERKGDKYSSLSDITDILGVRIICYFSDDVDKAATLIENMFAVDWDNSVDKRAQLNPDAFGYLSLHYICYLDDDGCPEELLGKKFEIQICSTLQHTWASINHDLGYKSEFGIPKNVTRELSRVAGLLEIADDRFIEIRNAIQNYGEEIKKQIENDTANRVLIDLVSLKEFVASNKQMKEYLNGLKEICKVKMKRVNPESYIEQLEWLGKKTIGDLQEMLSENSELALRLAKRSFEEAEPESVSTNDGLRFLCRAELLNKEYSLDEITRFMKLGSKDEESALRQAEQLVNMNLMR